MKKHLTIIFSIVFVLALAFFIAPNFAFKNSANALSETKIATEIVMPTTYLEYQKLTKPVDVWTNGNEFVIAEEKRIVYFDGTNYHETILDSQSISKIAKVGNYILFLSRSTIYSLSTVDSSVLDTGIHNASSFATNGNFIVTNPTGSIEYYSITDSTNSFSWQTQSAYFPGLNAMALSVTEDLTVYYSNESTIYCHKFSSTSDTVVASDITNVRFTAYGDETLYVSASNGIYKIDISSRNQTLLAECSTDISLGHAIKPQGISYCDKILYFADETLNSINGVNTDSGTFTNKFITADFAFEDRISKAPKSIFADSDKLFILDENSIKVTNTETNKTFTLSLLGFSDANYIASTGKTILVASTSGLKMLDYENDTSTAITIAADVTTLKNIVALSVFENDYYILNNEIENSTMKSVLYKLSGDTKSLTRSVSVVGLGQALTCDLFGDIYIETFLNSAYNVYKTDVANSTPTLFCVSETKFLSFYADYEGNLFALSENNKLIKTKTDETKEEYVLSISPNLPSNESAISMAIAWASNKSYFLFNGFVLSVSGDEIAVSTPKKISVPDNFEIVINADCKFVTIENGAKLFEVDLSCAPDFGEYFNYTKMNTQTSETEEFVLLLTTERYSLVANERVVAIVRTEDTHQKQITVDETTYQAFVANDCNVYAYPILSTYSKIANTTKNNLLSVKKSFVFNNTNYVFVEGSNFVGYVAKSMLKNDVASDINLTKYTVYTLTAKVDVYPDYGFITPCASLESGETVKVVEIVDGKAKILLDGKYYYIDAASLTPKGNTIKRNVLIISLLALSIFITCVFLGRKALKTQN